MSKRMNNDAIALSLAISAALTLPGLVHAQGATPPPSSSAHPHGSTVRISASHEEQDPHITLRSEHGEVTECDGSCLRETSPGPATVEVRWGHGSPHVFRGSVDLPAGRSLVHARRGDRDIGLGVLALVLGATSAALAGVLYWIGENGNSEYQLRAYMEPSAGASVALAGALFVVGSVLLGLPDDSITLTGDEHAGPVARRRARSFGIAAAPSLAPSGLVGASLQVVLRF